MGSLEGLPGVVDQGRQEAVQEGDPGVADPLVVGRPEAVPGVRQEDQGRPEVSPGAKQEDLAAGC